MEAEAVVGRSEPLARRVEMRMKTAVDENEEAHQHRDRHHSTHRGQHRSAAVASSPADLCPLLSSCILRNRVESTRTVV